MLAKIALLFLLVMAVLGIFGKLRVPGAARLANRKCPRCGRYRIGGGPCDCGKNKG